MAVAAAMVVPVAGLLAAEVAAGAVAAEVAAGSEVAAGAAAAGSLASGSAVGARGARGARAAAYPGERAAGAKSHDLTADFTGDAAIGLEAPQAPKRRLRS